MRSFRQAAIWGLANATAYGVSAATLYPNATAPDPSDRWTFGVVAFGWVVAASTLVGWQVIRTRTGTPARAWRLGGLASCVAAGLAYVPVLYWVTRTTYAWYLRDREAPDYTLMTFAGGVLALPISVAAIFLIVTAATEGPTWLRRHRGGGKSDVSGGVSSR